MAQKKALRSSYPGRWDIPLLIGMATALFIAGIFLPILTLKSLVMKNTFSVLSGIQNLWTERHFVLAFIILFFSILFPVTKLVSLAWIWFAKVTDEKRKKVLFWLKILGKWSMLDVFVVAVVIVAVKFGFMASAEPRMGVYVFGAAILLSMLLTFSIDLLSSRDSKNQVG